MSEIKKIKQAEIVTLKRSDIHIPDYNPRKIDKENAKKLKKYIKEDTLVDTIIVNKQTMNIVGGTQRITALDSIYHFDKGKDYQLNVQMIDVDEKKEAIINVRLNNMDSQGEYDPVKLSELIEAFEIDVNEFGFDNITMDYMFAGSDTLFTEENEEEKTIMDEYESLKQSERMRQAKQQGMEKEKELNKKGHSKNMENDDYIVTFVFNSNIDKWDFLQKIGKKKEEKFLKYTILRDILKEDYIW